MLIAWSRVELKLEIFPSILCLETSYKQRQHSIRLKGFDSMLKFSPKLGVKLGVSSLAIFILTACGGGGSDSSSPAPVAVNQAPVASAGSKLSIVTEGQPFTLDASGSTDANGDSLSYEWRQTAGPVVQIASPTNPTLELVAPLLDADEALSFELTVSDGEFSRSASVSLEVEAVSYTHLRAHETLR